MDITQSLQNAFNDIVAFLPKALAFLAILLIGWFIAKWIGKLVDKLLGKAGLDRLGERAGLRRFTGNYEMSSLFGKLIYYMLLLFVLHLAFGVFDPNPVSNLLTELVGWLPQLLVAILILVVAFAVANAVYGLVSGVLSDMSYGRALARTCQVAIIFIGAVAATSQAGIADSVTQPILWAALAAVVGVVVVGVGGGLIGPMRQRWERMLSTAEAETQRMKETRQAPSDPMARPYSSGRYDTTTDTQTQTRPQSGGWPQAPQTGS